MKLFQSQGCKLPIHDVACASFETAQVTTGPFGTAAWGGPLDAYWLLFNLESKWITRRNFLGIGNTPLYKKWLIYLFKKQRGSHHWILSMCAERPAWPVM